MRETTMELRRQIGAKTQFISRFGGRSIGAVVRRRMSPHLEALESRRLLTGISQIAVPSGIHAGPDGFAAGPGNSLWFTEFNSDKIAVVDAATHAITEFQLPTNNAQPLGIAEGPDGNMWFTESGVGQIGMINAAAPLLPNGKPAITEYSLGNSYAIPYGITAGPNDTVWFTEQGSNAIGMFDIAAGNVSLPIPIPTADSVPEGITLGPGGSIWFTESLGNQIGTIDPTTHVISEFGGLSAGSQPNAITLGTNGDLWFTEYAGNKIGMIDSTTHVVSEFSVPTSSSKPAGITAGVNGKLWFTEYAANQIGTIDSTTHAISEISVPSAGSEPVGIAAGPHKTVWFAEKNSGNVAVIAPTLHLVVTGAPNNPFVVGNAFGLSVKIEDDSNTIDTDYNGPVSVSLAASPTGGALGGTLTATAVDGVASFAGLTLNEGGSFTIQVGMSGAAPALVALPLVTAPASSHPVKNPSAPLPPEIISEQVLTKGKGKHKSIVGFKLVFNSPLDAATAQNTTNYTLTQSMKRGREKVARAIRVRVGYDPSTDTVNLLFSGKPRFTQGGQLVVNAAGPDGIQSATGVSLDGNGTGTPGTDAILEIKPNMRSITG